MRILYLIGNGFDLNLGLKTRYIDFYHYYHSINSDNENIQKLKNDIKHCLKADWSDLELALGKYTNGFIQDEFEEVFDDLLDNLAEYLLKEEEKFSTWKIDEEVFYEFLKFPENSFNPRDRREITRFKEYQGNSWKIDIATFNYTRTLERFMGDNTKPLEIGMRGNTPVTLSPNVDHIHGYLNNRMILGVNDTSQINNKTFHEIPRLLDAIVKSDCNLANGELIDQYVKAKINNANLICLYGSSIGDTDNLWWEIIGERLKNDKSRLLIFIKGKEIDSRKRFKIHNVEREIRQMFLRKTNLTESQKKSVEKKIFVGVNTNLFANIVKSQVGEKVESPM